MLIDFYNKCFGTQEYSKKFGKYEKKLNKYVVRYAIKNNL